MGMDLFIYKQIKEEDENLESVTITKKEILENTKLEGIKEIQYKVDEIFNENFKEQKNSSLNDYAWVLEYDSELNYILYFKKEELVDKFYEEFENDKVKDIIEFMLKNYNIDFNNYKNKNKIIEDENIKLKFFSKKYLEKFEEDCILIKNLKEIGYVRKPFRFFNNKPIFEGNNIILSTNNTTGVDKEKYNKLIKNREEDYYMFFTSNTKEDNELLFEISNNETKELLKNFLPLEKDVIIEINW